MAAKTVFMFSGQGSQYYQMGKQLFDDNALFRQSMLRLDDLAHAYGGERIVDAIYGGGKADLFDQTRLTHPAIFMVEYSLARTLIGAGIEPDLVLGASLGAFAAAAVAGYIGVDDALEAVLEQAMAFDATCERGGMLAVLGAPALFDEPFMQRSTMAGINFEGHFAVAGADAELDLIGHGLTGRDVNHQRLAVSYAYHSPAIDPAEARFGAFMGGVARREGHVPLVCCARAETLTDLPDDFYWRAVRSPLRFQQAIGHLERQGQHRYIDLGPAGTLATFVKYGLDRASASSAHALLTPYGRDSKNLAALLAHA